MEVRSELDRINDMNHGESVLIFGLNEQLDKVSRTNHKNRNQKQDKGGLENLERRFYISTEYLFLQKAKQFLTLYYSYSVKL